MKRIFIRIPSQFFRISLHTEKDILTLALVPDIDQAHLIGHILSKNYGLRSGEKIVVLPTLLRPLQSAGPTSVEMLHASQERGPYI